MRACALAAALAVGIMACGKAAQPTAPPHIDLGTGLDGFAPMVPGEELPIELGLQGGYHLTLNALARDLVVDGSTLEFSGSLTGDTMAVVCSGTYRGVQWTESPTVTGAHELPNGARCFVPDPTGLTGQVVRIGVTLNDGSGRQASDQREVVLGPIRRPY